LTKEEKKALAEEAARLAAEAAALAAEEERKRLAQEKCARQKVWGEERKAELASFLNFSSSYVERVRQMGNELARTRMRE